MILVYVVIILSAIALASVVLLIWGQSSGIVSLDELALELRSVDVNAFLNLIDPREEDYLRRNLPAGLFRRIHRERMYAAITYTWAAARNARILCRLADAGTHDPETQVARAAERLLQDAVVLRLWLLRMLPSLIISALFAGGHAVPESLGARYDAAASGFIIFARLRTAAAPSRAA